MTVYDYAVLVFYFVYMLAISWVFRKFVTNVSDYFRGGGKAVWWMVGGSAFMAAFSAWTFTGAASKAYTDGWPIMAIYVANAVGFVLNAVYFAPRFRQLRVITSVEAIRERFGRVSEQVMMWLQIPLSTLQAAIHLNALGVFFAAVFGLDLTWTIVVTGVVVLVMALVGGSWAVLAGDFIQVLILMPVCLAVTVLAILRLGGWDGFVAGLPPSYMNLGQIFTTDFLGLWCVAMLLKQITSTNNLFEAGRYLAVKDGRHARWAGYLGAVLFIIGIVIWFLPPMAAKALGLDLGAMFPGLGKSVSEASFIAISQVVMPVGMLGLLVSGIFAATMSGMDSGLNKNAGIFIKNFYQPLLRPNATDAQMLRLGQIATVVLGIVVIYISIRMAEFKDLGLFLLMQRVSILVAVPITVPLLLGLLIRNTPPWSAWSTVLVGFFGSFFVSSFFTPEWGASFFGHTQPLTPASREYWIQGFQFFANVALASVWFVGTKLFWNRCSATYRAQVDAFFVQMNTPVDFDREEGAGAANDNRQSATVGWLSVAYGAFVCLLAFIPNTLVGRLAFLGCGGVVLLIGGALILTSRRTPHPS
ncbi:sodium:solute symporter family transporter [Horticoccus sp. 23ND18S-11]|uniref:sodium:solute symporter family transporter n=1 Tax=Horticoccus sp. 23ND18S-11 TaxID=3391832 RepID=UPI0039C99FB6